MYAPVGLAVLACEQLPRLVDLGRARVEPRITVARFLGQMVVTQGRREVERRLRPEPAPATATPVRPAPAARSLSDEPPDTVEVPAATEDPDATVSDAIVTEPVQDAPPAEHLPIASYESLSAGQIVPLLGGLDAGELELVRRFESAHRHRRTVLGRIDRLVAAS